MAEGLRSRLESEAIEFGSNDLLRRARRTIFLAVMRPFQYHQGQREVQREANSIECADKLSTWVGPVVRFASIADLIVLASPDGATIRIGAVSGPPPLVDAHEAGEEIILDLPADLGRQLPAGRRCGGIVINPAEARRSRVSGILADAGDHLELQCRLAFTNCRKYMTPTRTAGGPRHVGPREAIAVGLDDRWIQEVVSGGETAFLVTTTPDGGADVSHRGGQPGFLHFDPATGVIEWTEYLGDGMFVSTGNLRADDQFALVVLDLTTGDAARLDGTAGYTNVRQDRKARVDALIQAGEPFPVQGRIAGVVRSAHRLVGFCLPRTRAAAATRITSADSTQVQHPQ